MRAEPGESDGTSGGPVPARDVVLANIGDSDIEVAAVQVLTYPLTAVEGGDAGTPKFTAFDYIELLATAGCGEFLLDSASACAGGGTFTVKAGGGIPLLALPHSIRDSAGNHVITMPMTTNFLARVHLVNGDHVDLEVQHAEGLVVQAMQKQLETIHEACSEPTVPLVLDSPLHVLSARR